MDDLRFMQMALDLAARGRGFTSPNPLVAAVVVKDGAVVGQGYHRFAGGPHAEVYAIDAAGGQARRRPRCRKLQHYTPPPRRAPRRGRLVAAAIRRSRP